jgi:hypothetical protein
MPLVKSDENIDKEILLVEYQKAQDSAQHHASMSWTATSIIWAASLVLIGFVYNNLTDSKLALLLTFICVLGTLLIIIVNLMVISLEKTMKSKYRRCKEIEKVLAMKQHTEIESSGISFRVFYNIITLLFIAVWSSSVWFIWLGNS